MFVHFLEKTIYGIPAPTQKILFSLQQELMPTVFFKKNKTIMWWPIVASALVVGSCVAGFVIEGSKEKESGLLVEALVRTVKSCYGKRVNAVSFAGNTDGILIRSLFEESIPVTFVSNEKRLSGDGAIRRKSLRQLQVCVVAASTAKNLAEILDDVRDSLWWNHLATFILLVWPAGSEDECSNAYEMLRLSWEFNLINVKLMCSHRAEGPMIYGFNPFTNKAPHPWELKKTYRGKNVHPWTLFSRRFQEDERFCGEMDFDKTNDLGGYEIRLGGILEPIHWFINVNKTGTDSFDGGFGNVAKILCDALNATCTPRFRNLTSYDVALEDVFNGITDILLSPRQQLPTVNLTTTYPHWASGLSVATQYSGYMSQLDKIYYVIDRTSRYGVCLVFFITLLFLKYCLRQDLTSAILNNIRLVCNGAILKVPQNQGLRFYLASLFIFVLTIQAIYQGKLASLLTMPVSLPNVDTMQDLANSRHMIYGYRTLASFFQDPIFKRRFTVLSTTGTCLEPVLLNFSNCCVLDRYYMINYVVKYNLYMSRDTITRDYWTHQIRQDWPLEQRVNIIIQRLVEANLIEFWYMKQVQTTIERSQFNAKLKDNQKFEIITLDELNFVFAILGIGLGIATALFIVEFSVNLRRLRIARILGYIQNVLGLRN